MNTQIKNISNKVTSKHNVHKVLAHSYLTYFSLLLIGIYLDLTFGFKIFTDSIMMPVGFVLLVFATGIIFWAQKTGHALRKLEEVKAEHFHRGPYRYTRIPTQWGLFFLILGFGIITNSLFVILATILSFFISNFVFLSKHDQILLEKYGTAYAEYKKMFKF